MSDFDLAAAALRADEADAAELIGPLATKLEGALPGRCFVDRRRRGVLSRREEVRGLVVELGARRFILARHHRHVVAEIESAVHDMRRRKEQVDLATWLAELRVALEHEAATSAEARAALERLL